MVGQRLGRVVFELYIVFIERYNPPEAALLRMG